MTQVSSRAGSALATTTADRLLNHLRAHAGSYCTGTDLGRLLGVSRTAIWKQVNSLKAEGHQLESTPNRGYRWVTGPRHLHATEVRSGLNTDWLGDPVWVLDRVASTNRWAMTETTLGHGAVVAALAQTEGRGRLGRTWQSPAGSLPFSLVLAPRLPPNEATLLTLATALGVVEGIHDTCGIELGIKWPNDLLWQGHKVVGILTEMRSDADRMARAVVGVGININTDTGRELPSEIAGRATSLAAITGQSIDPAALLRRVLTRLEPVYDGLWGPHRVDARAQMMADYRDRCITLGQTVNVTRIGHRSQTGQAIAVDEEGRLVVEIDGQRHHLLSADVSLSATAGRSQ